MSWQSIAVNSCFSMAPINATTPWEWHPAEYTGLLCAAHLISYAVMLHSNASVTADWGLAKITLIQMAYNVIFSFKYHHITKFYIRWFDSWIGTTIAQIPLVSRKCSITMGRAMGKVALDCRLESPVKSKLIWGVVFILKKDLNTYIMNLIFLCFDICNYICHDTSDHFSVLPS